MALRISAEEFCSIDTLALARRLIGARLLVEGVGGLIVETEAYRPDDPASHSFSGPTPRNSIMFGAAGRAYVYRSYGLHWCLNIVSGDAGGAVLLRALEPEFGLDTMEARRGVSDPRLLCAGPGRLCQALNVTGALNGKQLDLPPFDLLPGSDVPVETATRIGITRAVDQPWRFTLKDSRFLSRRVPRA